MTRAIKIFLLILIIISFFGFITQKAWAPRLVDYFSSNGHDSIIENENDLPLNQREEYVTYKSSIFSPEFIYPKYWGEAIVKKGNKICPEEDAYSTSDTLHIFDDELVFDEIKLPESQSFIRIGIRNYLLDPKNLNSCGDDFHLKIANKEIIPETLSSFKLNSITLKSGLSGIKNEEAVTINTTARTLYTFFVSENSKIHIIQTYMSFIPYYGSPELREMEEEFGGDINEYIKKGETALSIRKYLDEFKIMSESLKFITE